MNHVLEKDREDQRVMNRRTFLLAATLPALAACSTPSDPLSRSTAQQQLAQLEQQYQGRIGVFAVNTGSNQQLHYRSDERFAVCSTFKLLLVSAILKQSVTAPELMQTIISYTEEAIQKSSYAPITEQYRSMTVSDLCGAALQYSDNAAANLLMQLVGGPQSVTAYAKSVGNQTFRLDRWEPELNTAVPGDQRDTGTPSAMGYSLQQLALGNALPETQRVQLLDWLRGNTTGAERIKAGVPPDWVVGDKTGTGAYGVANDLAVLWPPQGAPRIISIYTSQHEQTARPRSDMVAQAARIVVAHI